MSVKGANKRVSTRKNAFLLSLFGLFLCAGALQAQNARPKPYEREFNTVAHQFLDLESNANVIDEKKYKLLDELLDSTTKQIPDKVREASTSDRDAALHVFTIVEQVLTTHNVVYNGWIDTLGDSFDSHQPSAEELIRIEFYNPNRQASIRANTGGPFYYMDCKTSAAIYLAVAELLHMPVSLVDIPGHFFVRWSAGGKSLNWDTNLAIEIPDAEYAAKAHIPEDLILKKIYLESLDKDQALGSWHGIVGDRLATLGRCEQAVEEHRKAVEMYRISLTEKNNLAWVLSTCSEEKYRKPSEAVQIATQVIDLWPEPNFVDTLAAAYADEHHWDEAVKTEVRAKTLSRSELHSEFDKPWPDFDRYINAYTEHKTYVEINSTSTVSRLPEIQPGRSSGVPQSRPSEAVRQYLTTLQHLYAEKPVLSTQAQRDTFCHQWAWIMASFKMSTSRFAVGFDALEPKHLQQIVDCDKALESLESFRQTPYSNPEFDWMKHYVDDRVAAAVRHLGLTVRQSPTIGTLPVGFLNARVVQVPDAEEPLIIVNDEVFQLPYGISKTVVQAINFRMTNGHYAYTLTEPDEINKYLDSNPVIVRNFEFVILQYLHEVAHVLDDPISLGTDLGIATSILYYGLADAMEIFIFSHEYAHLALGHIFQSHKSLVLDGGSSATLNVDEKVYSWKQELEADAYGFLIMDAVLQRDAINRSGDLKKDSLYPFFLSAPSFFFMSMDVVERDKAILESGQAPPRLGKEDLTLAERAVEQLFNSANAAPPSSANLEQGEHSNSHPPFLIRFVEAKTLEQKAQSLFLADNEMPAETAQVYRLGNLFEQTLLLLSDRMDPLFKARYLSASQQDKSAQESRRSESKENLVRPNDLSPTLVQEELKARGVNALDHNKAGAVTDDFVRYHFLVGDSANLVSESPSVMKAAEKLAASLTGTGLRSKVVVRTKQDGARIHFQLIGRNEDISSARLTNDAEDEIPIGFYFIWADRQGHPTSSKADIFRIVSSKITVDIEETLNAPK